MNDDHVQAGQRALIAPGVVRITAPNPSPMTGPGTNSYVVGDGPFLVVDPGVDDAAHLEALWAAADGRIAAILLTHRHPDHSGGAARLAERAGAPVRAWPKPVPAEYDRAITVHEPLADGESVAAGNLHLVARHTPGHAADHLTFELPARKLLLAGDTLMSDATVVILPPDGSMGAYLATLDALARLPIRQVAPGHGRLLRDPAKTIRTVIAHRHKREMQVLGCLSTESARAPEAIVAEIYPGLGTTLRKMATRQLLAHLIHLGERGLASAESGGWRALPAS